MIRAGDLDRRIELGSYQLGRGSNNEPLETFVPFATVWASWRRATANERLAAGMVAAQVTDVFTIRWSSQVSNIDPKCILRFSGRAYDIVEVTEIGRREGILIRAAARVDTGGKVA